MILLDMKMPMKCAECPLEIYDQCIITNRAVSCESFCRPYFCPLHYEGIDISGDDDSENSYHRNVAGLSDI